MEKNVEAFLRELLESGSPMLLPGYSGIPTFMRTPAQEELSDLDIALIGVPFDAGVTDRAGARHGPREIRNRSSLRGFQHHQSKIIPFQLCRIADVGDVPFPDRFALDAGIDAIEAFYTRVAEAGVAPISAGGDHSITYPILKALGAAGPLGLVHVDAHCDTMVAFDGSKFHHGGPFRNAVEAGVLDPKRTIQVGIRGLSEPFWEFSYETGMRVIHIEEFYEMGLKKVIAEARRVVGDGPTYVSFDVDGLDPAYTPGTGTPEIGGLTTFEGQQLIRGLQGLNLVGGDVVEVAPPFDPSGNTALVGATMMFEILCVVADAVAKRKN
jgi:agmatinase